MNTIKYLPLIAKNSLRNRRRSALTIGSVAVSLCLLGVLMAMYRALFFGEDATPAQALRLVLHHKVSLTMPLPTSLEEKVRQVPGVKAVMIRQWFGGTYRDARDTRNFFARFAIEPRSLFGVYSELTIPEDQRLAFERQRTACVASADLANKFGWKPGERITIVGDIFPVTLELTLAGIFDDPGHNEVLFFNWEYMRESLPPSSPARDTAGQFLIEAESPDDVPRVTRAVDEMYANSPEPTKTESERAFQLSFVSFLGNLKLFLMAICGAVTFTILLVSANTLSMSVRERIREVGIMKTLGFTPSAILGIILGEAAAIALIGGAIGCVLAGLLCALLRQAPSFIQALRILSVTPLIAVLTLAVALAVGLVSALVPALSASRTPILDSLRHTG
ncbi:MAG TPA: ABC transporter permease [Blastocatellia bacterium]|nr:ABC transporter permease [Blastocatellia bacterium]